MLTVVTYLWQDRGPCYKPGHVKRLQASVARWLSVPHRFVCLTDLRIPGVETRPNPAPEYPKRCYRRLWLFSPQARKLGERLLHLDLDVVVCGSLDHLVARTAPLIVYKAGSIAARGWSLNPSVLWLETGTQTDIWQTWRKHPSRVAAYAKLDGWWGSDQAVLSYLRRDTPVETYGPEDGVVSFRHIRGQGLTEPPPGTCLVSFHGRRTPFEAEVQAAHPWIREAWSAQPC